MPYYRRRYSQRKQRAINLQLEAEQARRELYWQARREISPQFLKLKLRAFDHLMYAVISAAFSFPVVAFLFWFVFPLGPYRGRASYEWSHYLTVLALFAAAIYFPGTPINEVLWPKVLRIAGYIVVGVAFYFGLKARANPLYAVPYLACTWIWI